MKINIEEKQIMAFCILLIFLPMSISLPFSDVATPFCGIMLIVIQFFLSCP